MIQVKQLTKIYKSRKSGTCTALDGVSFTLPDKGFMFVIGKSGSGKTTLLSLLGGLDTITSGEIIVNGRHIEKFTLNEQVYYRNSTIGFIFQDFHLIDDLTIYENIALALELRGEDDREKVLKALADIDLAEFENRYPKELSGGQKQRVAIARALVKQPTIILADEPTGNLDSKTTAQILDLLKELSKEKLVVIVSHNLSDAEHYADEILELSDGKILQHVKRNETFDSRLRVEDDTLVIPVGERFDDENIKAVGNAMKTTHVTDVRQQKDRFLPHDEVSANMPEERPIERKHLRARGTAKLSVKFAKRSLIRTCVYSVIFAAVLVVLGLSQLIMNFNGGEVIAKEMAKRNLSCTSFIKDNNDKYEVTDTTRLVDVKEDDLQKFYDAGYEGKAYPLVNYALYNSTQTTCYKQSRLNYNSNPYNTPASSGVLITDEEFLVKKFGKLEYIIVADEQRADGVFITDYFADAVINNLASKKFTYNDLLKEIRWNTVHSYGYVNGIIYTGYKERYKELLEKLTDPTTSKEEIRNLSEKDEFLAFFDELTQYLNIAYTFNKDFINANIEHKDRQLTLGVSSTFEIDGMSYAFQDNYFSDEMIYNGKHTLHEDEIMMTYTAYNNTFGTTYTLSNYQNFTPHTVNLCYYLMCDTSDSVKKYEKTVTIVRLVSSKVGYCFLSEEVFEDIQRLEMFTSGYYFDNAEQTELLANVAAENGFIPNSVLGSSITTMSKAVGVFSRFFYLIFGVLCAAMFVLMAQFEVKSIKDKMEDIGILKALGARDVDLLCIFGFQIVMAGALMLLLYIAGSFIFVGAANRLLVFSLSELAKNVFVADLTFLSVKWSYILQNCLLSIAILVVSFLVPMFRLRYIKPSNVIKAKE